VATGQAPKGCKGILAVVWEGPIDGLTEAVRPVQELQTWETVKPAEVPDDWWDALVAASGVGKPRPPKPEPAPEPPAPKPREPCEPRPKPNETRYVHLWDNGPMLVALFWIFLLLTLQKW
jgi:hypothetical protein